MNVLHLTTHLNTGGITTYIYRLAPSLRKFDIDLQVLSSGGEWTEAFQKEGISTYEFDIRTKSELHPKIYWAIPSIIRLIRKKKIDLLHAHTRITQVMAFWVRRFTGIPVVTTCHGFYKQRLGRRLLPAWGDRAIAISELVGDHLVNDFHVVEKKVRIIHNAVDIEKLDEAFKQHDPRQSRKKFGFPEDALVVGVVARLVRDKGQEYLIRAIHALKDKFPKIRLLIVGEGRDRSLFEDEVKSLKMESYVHFSGNMTDVTRALAAVDVFAFPAIWREGFGLSIIEAMTCRLPVIVSNIWALNALIQSGITGILVEPKKVDVLAEAIERFLVDPVYRSQIGNQGRARVEELFCINRMAQDIAKVYQEVSKPHF